MFYGGVVGHGGKGMPLWAHGEAPLSSTPQGPATGRYSIE